MGQRTSEDYLRELKIWYENHRDVLHAGMLVGPSNGELRNLCLTLLRNGLSLSDQAIFRDFFKVGVEDDLSRAVSGVDIEKFRPIVNFLNGASQTRDKTKLNLIAVLIDFPERPLPVFLKKPDYDKGAVRQPAADVKTDFAIDKPVRSKKRMLWFVGFCMVAVAIVLVLAGIRSAKNCMVWQNDHYSAISCEDTTVAQISKEPIDAKQFRLKRIPVSKKTRFFVDGKPNIWYLKNGNQYEFFNQSGYHPLRKEKTLKPVTSYIAMKIVAGEIGSGNNPAGSKNR